MTEQNQNTEDPTPTDPSSTDPISADPTPTDQFSADPIPTDPTPTDPISAEPTPAEPVSTEPTSSDQDSNGSSTGKTIGIILLALVGVVVVLVLGYFLAPQRRTPCSTTAASVPISWTTPWIAVPTNKTTSFPGCTCRSTGQSGSTRRNQTIF